MKQEFSEDKNITIGDQEFQKVGEMKSEPTEERYTPKSYDLYQDVDSGALVGKLPEDYPNDSLMKKIDGKKFQETLSKLRNNLPLDMNLPRHVSSVGLPALLRDENIKMYGMIISERDGEKIYDGELQVLHKPELAVEGKYSGFIITAKDGRWSEYIRVEAVSHMGTSTISFHTEIPWPEGMEHTVNSRRLIRCSAGFLEVPQKYKDLLK